MRPTKEKLVPQRLKDLSETDEENKGLVKIALQKRRNLGKKRSNLDKKKQSDLDKSFLSITSDQSIEY